MKHRPFPVGVVATILFLLLVAEGRSAEEPALPRIAPPPDGKLYHGVYPGGKTGEEDDLTAQDLSTYETAVGAKAAWVYFSNNWFRSRKFPAATAGWIRQSGAVPFVRLMLRTSAAEDVEEKTFTLEAIRTGRFDDDLKAWAREARTFGTPLIVEWGTECNGKWFPWNGEWHGGKETKGFGDPEKADGPERFVAAFRHIVETMRGEGASNLTWVFHPNAQDDPEDEWNRFENYWPGADVVDWIAVSVYGAKTPDDDDSEAASFRKQMDRVYPRLVALDPAKPIIVAEFGATAGHEKVSAEEWGEKALKCILDRRWPRVTGFSWWNERWENGKDRADTTMRVQDIPELARVFKERLEKKREVIAERPVVKQ